MSSTKSATTWSRIRPSYMTKWHFLKSWSSSSIFQALEKDADCILASNSSSYKSVELLTKFREPAKQRVLNTHLWCPAGTSQVLMSEQVNYLSSLCKGICCRVHDQRNHGGRHLPVPFAETCYSWFASFRRDEGIRMFHFQLYLSRNQARGFVSHRQRRC